MIEKEYIIGGVKYYQTEIVLWQQEALSQIIDIEAITEKGITGLIKALFAEGRLAKALAIILLPKEGDLALEEKEKLIRQSLTMSLQAEILKDFFDCNAAALKKWAALGKEAKETAEGSL